MWLQVYLYPSPLLVTSCSGYPMLWRSSSNPAPWGAESVSSSVSLACPFSLVLLSSEGGHWALPEDQRPWPCSVKALEPTCSQGDSWPQFPPSTASLSFLAAAQAQRHVEEAACRLSTLLPGQRPRRPGTEPSCGRRLCPIWWVTS